MSQSLISAWLTPRAKAAIAGAPEPGTDDGRAPSTPSPPTDQGKEDKDKATGPSYPTTTPSLTIPRPPSLPSEATLHPLTRATLPSFRRINALLLPIPYPPSFYRDAAAVSAQGPPYLTLVAEWARPIVVVEEETAAVVVETAPPPPRPLIVAAIRCRLLPQQSETGGDDDGDGDGDGSGGAGAGAGAGRAPFDKDSAAPRPLALYISTLATLSPYRSRGLASALLDAVLTGLHPRPSSSGQRDQAYAGSPVAVVEAHVWEANDDARAWYRRRGFQEVACLPEYYARLRPSGAVLVRRAIDGGGGGGGVGYGDLGEDRVTVAVSRTAE